MDVQEPVITVLVSGADSPQAERLRTLLRENGYAAEIVERGNAAGGGGPPPGDAAAAARALQECSEDLRQVTHELEAFSYSVSHDLRSPIRAITGFSNILINEHLPALPEEVQHHLLRIQAAAQRMGQLIEDLLQLSRINRHPLRRASVNLSEIAQEIAAALWQGSSRQVEFRIADDLVATGDPRLLRTALEQLIANAWKFTGKLAAARIEVGVQEPPEGRVFYVRDNGAGFDMSYVDKLFGVFQRLHRTDEFEGTGIGLAIVQRIMARHGGRVWAQGSPDQGATFFFTLPG